MGEKTFHNTVNVALFQILNQSPKGKGKDQKLYNGSWDMDFFFFFSPKG